MSRWIQGAHIYYFPCIISVIIIIPGAELAVWRVCARLSWPDQAGVSGGQWLRAGRVPPRQVPDSVRHVTRANSDRDLNLVTNILRRAEETPERCEEDRLPPFMSSVTYKVPWDSRPESEIHPLPTITGGVTNYYKCFFRIFYTQKINETKFGVI